MTEDVQRAEKNSVKEGSNEASSQQVRESLSHEAMRSAQNAAGKDAGSALAAHAGGMMSAKESLPNLMVHENGHNAYPKEGIVTTYGPDGQPTSDCNGPLPRHGKMDSNKQTELFNKTDDLSKQMKDGTIKLEDFQNKISDLFKQKDGVQQLATGDYLVREDGRQSLFTPNGDRITLNPDGTHTIKGDVQKVSTGKDGTTTVQFGDGATVSFDREGFRDIQRGDQSVSFGRPWNELPVKPHYPMPAPNPFPFPRPFPRDPNVIIDDSWIKKLKD